MILGDRNPQVDAMRADVRNFQSNEWKYTGFQMFLFPHPVYPFDPVVIRRFRQEIDPSFLAIWLRHAWKAPTGEVRFFDYHLLSFENPQWDKVGPDSEENPPHRDFAAVLQPTLGPSRRPHDYIEILHSKSRALAKAVSPKIIGIFQPFSMLHVHKYREITWLNEQVERKKLADAQLEAHYDRIRKVDEYWQAESDYRWDHDWAHLQKNVEGLTTEERALLYADRDHRAALRQQLGVGHTMAHAS